MKKVMWLAVVLAIVSLSVYGTLAFASQDDIENHDYVQVAPKGKDTQIPHGHFMIIAQYFNELMSNPPVPGSWNMIAASLFDGIDDPALNDEISDFFVVDIRTPTEFCLGHIPQAQNIPYNEIAKPENLALLPFDKPVLLICNGGFNASVAQGVLRIMGYDAWALRGGMLSLRSTTNFPLASAYTEIDPVTGKESYTEKNMMNGLANANKYKKSIPEANRPVIVKCQ